MTTTILTAIGLVLADLSLVALTSGLSWSQVSHPARQWRIWREARTGVTWSGNGWYEALMAAPEGPREH